MSSSINVEPYSITKTNTVTSFSIRVIDLTLFSSVTLMVSLFDASGNLVTNQAMTLNGDNYTAWGSDDSYINTYVATQLGTSLS